MSLSQGFTHLPPNVPPFMSTQQAAAFLGISPRTLEKYRVIGCGPEFTKIGTRVLYSPGDLMKWTASRKFSMTSDPGATRPQKPLPTRTPCDHPRRPGCPKCRK